MSELQVLADTTDPRDLRRLAEQLALGAGDILRQGLANGYGTVDTKSSATDPVTEIDRASEAHILSNLQTQRPHDGVFGEEGTRIDSTNGVRWVVDPLDGTVNFMYGIPAFAVSIGVERDGIAVAGAVYNPITDEMFSAALGHGATRNNQPIGVRADEPLRAALVATGFAYQAEHRREQAELLVHVLPNVRDIRRTGSAALNMCAVAMGRLDGYYEKGTSPWDVVAGEIIVTEAGGGATGWHTTRPVNDVVVGSAGVHEPLRRLITRS